MVSYYQLQKVSIQSKVKERKIQEEFLLEKFSNAIKEPGTEKQLK
jgi:hypothetical protein